MSRHNTTEALEVNRLAIAYTKEQIAREEKSIAALNHWWTPAPKRIVSSARLNVLKLTLAKLERRGQSLGEGARKRLKGVA